LLSLLARWRVQEAALADYSEAIKIDPNDSALFNGRAFAALRTASSDGCDRQTLEGALKDVNQALALDENNGAAYCTKGEILKQMALAASSGDTAGAAAEGGSETTVERKRLIDEAIVAQRCAIRLEPEAQEPRDYLRELLAMAGIDEEVADADEQADWASSTRSIPAPKPEASGAAAAAAAPAAADGGCEVQYPEGWLHKKGGLKDGERNWIKGGKRNWKVRWVSFDGVLIRWYDGKGGKELGSVELGPFDRVEVDADECVISARVHALPALPACLID
jgi:tetratricopeptide (TPR) repeat protein